MQIIVRVDGGDLDEVRSLRDWLADEQPVRRHGRLRYADAPGDSGAMGPVLDALSLALSSGLSLLQVVFAIAQWRTSRPAAPTVRVTLERPGGGTVRIETSDPEALARLVRSLERS
ncbi:MAG TPA: hypothetical protein VNV66_01845 [Pilimelia sp.]|nr:hypothetical protein [Pilimelia sp.]